MTDRHVLPANVTISRFQANMEPREGITIRIGDELSGTQIIEVTMTAAEFGRAITGLGHSKGTHDLSVDRMETLRPRIGRQVRAETVQVPFDMFLFQRDQRDAEAARQSAEIMRSTGCAAVRTDDLFNMHRRFKTDPPQQSVTIWFYDEVQEESQ